MNDTLRERLVATMEKVVRGLVYASIPGIYEYTDAIMPIIESAIAEAKLDEAKTWELWIDARIDQLQCDAQEKREKAEGGK